MDSTQSSVAVRMIRPTLEGTPTFPLADEFTLRWYEPGDEDVWYAIQSLAEDQVVISDALYGKEFGADASVLEKRQCFLYHDVEPVGTATAWFDDDFYGERYGKVHWVAVVPTWRGRGLSKVLLSAICQRLQELGHRKAYLLTSSTRIPAVSLYARFAFQPLVCSESERGAWEEVRKQVEMSEPIDIEDVPKGKKPLRWLWKKGFQRLLRGTRRRIAGARRYLGFQAEPEDASAPR